MLSNFREYFTVEFYKLLSDPDTKRKTWDSFETIAGQGSQEGTRRHFFSKYAYPDVCVVIGVAGYAYPVLNEWVLDIFDVKADYGKTYDDPYSRRLNEYRKERFHEGTSYPWHDEGFEEEERWESGIERQTMNHLLLTLKHLKSKGRVNRSRFIRMIRKEIDEEGGTIRKM
uniref:Uncharacterized protein n=1 Tax=Tanacetum cinerariifolium TaxID=118510 RepID=A0A6L2KAR0_TANCI|nr:hypothetical protein [Tanacetum cinerariifolium]